MPKLEVELVIDDPLHESGGPVFVSINRLSSEAFNTRYEDSQVAASSGSLVIKVRLSSVVNFVEIDTPEGDYVYRFINDPKGPYAKEVIEEVPIGVAGAGVLYIDLATNDPVQSNGGRDHYINGTGLSKDESIGLQNNSLDLRVDPATCVVSGPVKVCPARQEEVDWLLDVFRSEGDQ